MELVFVICTALSLLASLQLGCADDEEGETNAPKWRSGAPDDLPRLQGLKVDCGSEDMTIALKFDHPFDGTIYSKPSGRNSDRCVHVAAHSYITEATFVIEYDRCNTRSDPKGKYHENTIVIQYDDAVIEAWDIAKKIRCEWHDGYEKSAFKQPIAISDLDVVEMNFQGDDVDCWLEIQDGKGPWSSKVEGLIPLGSPLTLVVAIQDSESQFDMRVKACKAHDGQRQPVYLTDEDGCVLRPKMMSPFVKTRDTKGTATIVSYSHFYAFKFPETVDVNVQCTVEICRHGCPDVCGEKAARKPPGYGHDQAYNGEVEDIPTYRDSNPPSSIVAGKPAGNATYNEDRKTELLAENSNTNTSTDKDLQGVHSEALTNFYPHVYPPNLFDVLHAEDRVDEHFDDAFVDPNSYDTEFAGNEADLEYKPPPEFLRDVYSNAKGFPSDEGLGNSSSSDSTDKQPSETQDVATLSPTTELQTRPVQGNDTVDEIASEIPAVSSTVDEVTTLPPLVAITDDSVREVTNENITSSPSHVIIDNLYEFPVTETNEHPTADDEVFDSEHSQGELLHFSDSDYFSQDGDIDAKTYSDDDFEKFSKIKDYDVYERGGVQARKRNDDKISEKPLDYYNYKPFKPPVPVPPLTLYNGIPLHYYHQRKKALEYMGRAGYSQAASYRQRPHIDSPFYKRHRRNRRSIGDKEQLGLQQTFRVIAPTDLDFVIRDVPVAKQKEILLYSLCMAKTSFASGLGLLLLGNVCVVSVAVFLAFHYMKHKRAKSPAMELLTKEIST